MTPTASKPSPRQHPRHPRQRTGVGPLLVSVLLIATLVPFGCAGPSDDRADRAEESTVRTTPAGAADSVARALAREGTLRVEGLAEPLDLELFRAPEDFPLPFTAYVPDDMAAEADPEGTAHFVAEFGGSRNEDAFVHLYVFPPDTDRQEALAAARGYKAGRGVPVSQGLEPIAETLVPPNLAWAFQAYRFRYQSGGQWYGGTLGVGQKADRFYMILRHYPVEYGDGFSPRADLIVQTWRWADGSRLAS